MIYKSCGEKNIQKKLAEKRQNAAQGFNLQQESDYETFLLDNEIEHYYCYLRQEDIFEDRRNPYSEHEKAKKKRQARTLSMWCFNPGLGFRKILKLDPRCLILTSGTLSPMKSFEQELLMEFPIRIENKHVIDPC